MTAALDLSGGDSSALIDVGVVDVGVASTAPVVAPVEDLPPVKGEVPKDQMDDLEFWLTDSKAAPPKEEPKPSPPQALKVEKKAEEGAKKAELSAKTESPESKPKEKVSVRERRETSGEVGGVLASCVCVHPKYSWLLSDEYSIVKSCPPCVGVVL